MLALLIGLQLAPIAGPVGVRVAKTGGSTLPNSTWLKWASNAWGYYGVSTSLGVDPTTGLPLAALIFIYFTFWDLGTYLYAIMDASRLGLLVKTGTWGSDDRVNRVVNWLQICQLTSNNLPYLWYNSRTGTPATDLTSEETNVSDYGQFLIAMYRLKTFRPDLAATIDNIVKVRFNTVYLAGSPEKFSQTGGIYAWYISQGFKYFGYDSYTPVQEALGKLNQMMNGPKVTTYGIALPSAYLTSEPLQLGMFFVDPDPQLTELTRNVYLAQEKRHDATGKWEAWSEGSTALPNPTYVYEWIVAGGETWVITPSPITPIAYLRTAIAYQALFDTAYTLPMIDYLNTTLGGPTVGGYGDGVDQNGRQVPTLVDRTNGIIIAAARFIYDRAPRGLNETSNQILSASTNTVYFIYADPYRMVSSTAPWQDAFAAYDATAAGFLYGLCANSQVICYDSNPAIVVAKSPESNPPSNYGKVLLSGKQVVVVGGRGPNWVVDYYERTGQTPLKAYVEATEWGFQTQGGTKVASLPATTDFTHNDLFVVMVFQDSNGNFVLIIYGLGWKGTFGGGVYFKEVIKPSLAAYTKSAYVFKWTDAGAMDGVPQAGEITKQYEGP